MKIFGKILLGGQCEQENLKELNYGSHGETEGMKLDKKGKNIFDPHVGGFFRKCLTRDKTFPQNS